MRKMHRCLKVPEILDEIVIQLDRSLLGYAIEYGRMDSKDMAYDKKREKRRNELLLKLAYTCKLFFIPAMDRLWYCQTELLNLSRVLPPCAQVKKEVCSHILLHLRSSTDRFCLTESK